MIGNEHESSNCRINESSRLDWRLANLGNRDSFDIEYLRKRFIDGEYAISDHAIIEAQKDGIVPRTVEFLNRKKIAKKKFYLLHM